MQDGFFFDSELGSLPHATVSFKTAPGKRGNGGNCQRQRNLQFRSGISFHSWLSTHKTSASTASLDYVRLRSTCPGCAISVLRCCYCDCEASENSEHWETDVGSEVLTKNKSPSIHSNWTLQGIQIQLGILQLFMLPTSVMKFYQFSVLNAGRVCCTLWASIDHKTLMGFNKRRQGSKSWVQNQAKQTQRRGNIGNMEDPGIFWETNWDWNRFTRVSKSNDSREEPLGVLEESRKTPGGFVSRTEGRERRAGIGVLLRNIEETPGEKKKVFWFASRLLGRIVFLGCEHLIYDYSS